MSPWHIIKPKSGKEIPFLILITFLTTFLTSRFLILGLPTFFGFHFEDIYLEVDGVHVHHLAYGIIILVITGFLSLIQQWSEKTRLKLSVLYGLGLGLAFDEFAMWVQLEDVYLDRSTYDAVVVIVLIMLNVTYFSDFWKKWGHHLDRLFKKIFS